MTAPLRAVLAVDLGTGGAKAALVAEDARILASAFIEYETVYPHPGWHEQRPQDWWEAVASGTREVMSASGPAVDIAAIALSGQSLALVPVDAELRPLLNAVPIWSDARASVQASRFFESLPSDEWYLKTGNGFPAELYTIFEYAWLREHRPETVEPARWLLGSKDWINARLTGQVATDHSYASGLGGYLLAEHRYDDDILSHVGIYPDRLPPIVAATDVVGSLTPGAAAHLGLTAGIPVVAGGVDNSCMALGAGLDAEGRCFLSLGSSNWLTIAGRDPVLDAQHRPYVFEHVLAGLQVSAFSTFGGGSSLRWLADLLGRDIPQLLEAAAEEPIGARGLICVPTLAGGTVAEGGSDVRGAFSGLDLSHGVGAMTRAVVEGIAFSMARTAELLAAHVAVPETIVAVGGGARSGLLLQTLADALDRRIVAVANDQHAAALGAAALGFLGVSLWEDTEPLRRALHSTRQFTPDARHRDVLTAARNAFDEASESTRRESDGLKALRLISHTRPEENNAPEHH